MQNGGLVSKMHPLTSSLLLSQHSMQFSNQNGADVLMCGDSHSRGTQDKFGALKFGSEVWL